MKRNLRSSASTTEERKKKVRRRFLHPGSLAHGLARELELLAPTYARLHAAHAALEPYPTLPLLLTRLTAGPRDQAKRELVVALISIRQSSPHRLWVAILLRAFLPMLFKLWKRLFGTDCQERLALLLLSFQTTLGKLNTRGDPRRVALRLRLAVRRRVIVSLLQEMQWSEIGFGEEADQVTLEPDPGDVPLRERSREVHRLLERGQIRAYLLRTHPGLTPRERDRLYHQLRRTLRLAFAGAPILGTETRAPS